MIDMLVMFMVSLTLLIMVSLGIMMVEHMDTSAKVLFSLVGVEQLPELEDKNEGMKQKAFVRQPHDVF